jgi:nucleotide-binding universal stress UspA family protein
MKIVVGMDFSAAATAASLAAAELARLLGDTVLLVNVVQAPVERHPELRVPDYGVLESAVGRATEKELGRFVAGLRERGIDVEGRVLAGTTHHVLAAVAAAERARLLVLGNSRRHALRRVFVGSVAERAILEAPCATLLVPEDAAPFDRWAARAGVQGQESGGQKPLRVVVGIDDDGSADALLSWVRRLREVAPCAVTLDHAYWPPGEYRRLGLTGQRDFFGDDPEVVSVLERQLAPLAARAGGAGTTTLKVHAAWGHVGDALAMEAEAKRADLLVVGTHQRHGWQRVKAGSSAIGAVRAASTAILCVPASARAAGAPVAGDESPSPARPEHLLVATDLSPAGNAAIPHAYALLGSGGGGRVELCHVHERHLAVPAYVYDDPARALPAGTRAELEECLRALVPAWSHENGITTNVTVVDGGIAWEAIVQAARRLGADTIVLASHGRSGLARALLGSVAEAVVRHADRPVWVVRAAAGRDGPGGPA